ncbi:hypothetical protein GCM10027578_14130 [Spirosoma luteolum]
MEDPKVLFADTTARRAQLIAATERIKSSITDNVESIREDATEVGKTVAFVAGVSLAVYLVVNAVLPKSDEYRFAEKYGEPDEDDYDEDGALLTPASRRQVKQTKETAQKTGAATGLISGLLTSVLTNIARQQLTGFIDRIRTNNAPTSTASPTIGRQYHTETPTEFTDYSSHA